MLCTDLALNLDVTLRLARRVSSFVIFLTHHSRLVKGEEILGEERRMTSGSCRLYCVKPFCLPFRCLYCRCDFGAIGYIIDVTLSLHTVDIALLLHMVDIAKLFGALFPQVHRLTKSVVDVHVMVLQADGGELAVATSCASMALADAGIELFDLVTACSVAYCGNQVTALKPCYEERGSMYHGAIAVTMMLNIIAG